MNSFHIVESAYIPKIASKLHHNIATPFNLFDVISSALYHLYAEYPKCVWIWYINCCGSSLGFKPLNNGGSKLIKSCICMIGALYTPLVPTSRPYWLWSWPTTIWVNNCSTFFQSCSIELIGVLDVQIPSLDLLEMEKWGKFMIETHLEPYLEQLD